VPELPRASGLAERERRGPERGGNTTVAALIGAGGFGTFVFQGLGQAAPDLILLGAIPVILMVLAADILMQGLISLLTPKGFSGGQR